MNTKDLEFFKNKLLEEKATLEQNLSGIAQKSGSAPGGWEATTGGLEIDTADENELADKLEELEDNNGIANQLEKQLTDVKVALEHIDAGTYGNCETCGKPIEIERLKANPAARISLKHGH
jgi:DnaK suppressor protein